jgi:hypothetical protein
MKQILFRRVAERLDRLLLATKPVVLNIDSTGTEDAEDDKCRCASWHIIGNIPNAAFRFWRRRKIAAAVGFRRIRRPPKKFRRICG